MASESITMTAISMLPPTPKQRTQWAALWREILAAPKRGLQVRVIIPAPSHAHRATHRNDQAAAALRAAGAHVILTPPSPLLHAKTVAIDAAISWVGSGNWTSAATDHNQEAWIRSTDLTIANDLAAFHKALAAGLDSTA